MPRSEVIDLRPSENVWPVIYKELSDNEEESRRVDTPPFSEAGSPTRKNNMEDLLSYTVRQGSFVVDYEEEEPEDDFQQDSDEEYEENVIEPRTLNEITTLTDRTSPWSSMVSESGQDLQTERVTLEDVPTNRTLLDKLSLISPVLQDDQDSNQNTARSCDSHVSAEYPEMAEGNGADTQNPGAFGASESNSSLGQDSPDLSDNEEEDRLRGEELTLGVTQLPAEMSLSGSEPDESRDLAMEGEDTEREVRDDYRSGYQSSSSHPESSHRDASSSVQSVEELPDVAEASASQHFNLLYP